jgi:hypothetical protein
MLQAYLNYPNPKVRIHRQQHCGEIGKMKKAGQRNLVIDVRSISSELQNFASKAHRFAADALYNDMWLTVDFYAPFGAVAVEHHC